MNLWQRTVGLVLGPSGRGLLTGGGECCCGPVTCECSTSLACGRDSVVSVGKFFKPATVGGPAWTEDLTPVRCCCYTPVQRGRIRWTLDRKVEHLVAPGGCTGLIQRTLQETTTPNPASGTVSFHERQWSSAGPPGCVVSQTLDQTTTLPFRCGGVGSTSGFGTGLVSTRVPANTNTTISLTGSFRINCTTIRVQWVHVYTAGTFTVRETYSETGSIEPDNQGHCGEDPSCLRACCLPNGECREGLSQVDCLGLGGVWSGPGVSCYEAGCDAQDPRDKGACCDPATGDCVIAGPEQCVSPRVFKGIGTACAFGTCPQPVGNCCKDGGCTIKTLADCTLSGGTWGGPQTNCSNPNTCASPGACCLPGGSCIETFPQSCTDQGGAFQGPGSLCAGVTCGQGACCLVNSHGQYFCSQSTQAECTGLFFPNTPCTPFPCPINPSPRPAGTGARL